MRSHGDEDEDEDEDGPGNGNVQLAWRDVDRVRVLLNPKWGAGPWQPCQRWRWNLRNLKVNSDPIDNSPLSMSHRAAGQVISRDLETATCRKAKGSHFQIRTAELPTTT